MAVAGEPYRCSLEVRWADSDRLGHVNNTKVVEYMQEARIKFLQSGELGRGAVAVRKMDVEFLRPLKDESGPLTVEIAVLHVGVRSYTLRHTILDRNGVVCAHGDAVLVGFDVRSETSRPLSDGERDVLDRHRVAEAH
ncbi:acyl-CoA thioesterase [Rhodococcus chondri]|uniref:Acyl-CoA thioesterase n=1 Tax=Rhodococcus chondri TaxID=3065941 RepID=A0ABU7JPA4_9NOCA|nr:acyl-CoA thioesterase [Rhodococcus sp. CC-R104]MEE2031866.1 acyl-CoA thioesterase [Rhodococcus sp. CC-R104]